MVPFGDVRFQKLEIRIPKMGELLQYGGNMISKLGELEFQKLGEIWFQNCGNFGSKNGAIRVSKMRNL